MTDTTAVTAAMAEVEKRIAALETVIDERRLAEAAVIAATYSGDVTVTPDVKNPAVGAAAMTLLYGASDVFQKIDRDWDDLISDIRQSITALAALQQSPEP